jgi:PII-like signaling protein
VDTHEKVEAFIPVVDELFEHVGGGGMMTLEEVNVIKYSLGKSKQPAA